MASTTTTANLGGTVKLITALLEFDEEHGRA